MTNKFPISAILKFITQIYQPSDISHETLNMTEGEPEDVIHLYFDEIDDKYMKNPQALDPIANKEKNLEFEIRLYLEKVFGKKTTGLQMNKWGPTSPWKREGLTIKVYGRR